MNRPVAAKVWSKQFLFRTVLPVAGILMIGLLGIFAFLTYRIIRPAAVLEPVNPSHYLLPSTNVQWSLPEGTQIEGWWIPGTEGAPGVLLAPGYGMSRADVLSLAAALYLEGYNVLTYDARGSGASPRGISSLGLRETDDMVAALAFLKSRPEVDAKCLGIWGVDVNARAALKVAPSLREVRAVVVDSAYESAADFMDLLVQEDLGWQNRGPRLGCQWMFRLYMLGSATSVNDRLPVKELGDIKILFIKGDNRKDIAPLTAALYDSIQPQKDLIKVPTARARLMESEELNSYDRQVVNFFHLNLH